MAHIRCIGLLVCLAIVATLDNTSATGCQNQECHWSIDCYNCAGLNGTMCKVNSCSNCEENACVSDPDGPVLSSSGLSWAASRVVSKACPAAAVLQQTRSVSVVPAQSAMQASIFSVPTEGISLNFFRQEDAPVSFVGIRFGAPEAFDGGSVRNFSDGQLVAIRVGWIVMSRNGTVVGYSTGRVPLASPVAADDEQTVARQKTLDLSTLKVPARVMFFVAEAEFQDGSTWKANVGRITGLLEAN